MNRAIYGTLLKTLITLLDCTEQIYLEVDNFRLFAKWRASDGHPGRRNNIQRYPRRGFRSSFLVRHRTESQVDVWPGREYVEVFYHVRSTRRLRTILRVSTESKNQLPTFFVNNHEPFSYRNMKRPVTFWYTKDQPIFENTDDFASVIDVARIPAGSDSPPCLKISHNTFETMEKANWEFLRLSLPVICFSKFIE